jgi:cytochrome b561
MTGIPMTPNSSSLQDPVDPTSYSRLSLFLHWLSAILIIALFATHEGERGSATAIFHVSGGAIAGVFLLWRVVRRLGKGMTTAPDQALIYHIASKIVLWGFLAAIVVVIVTGYLLPWSVGQAIDVYGLFSIPSPMSANRDLHEFAEELHEISGQLFVPLIALHVLGAAKHFFVDKDGVAQRMFRASDRGI